MDQLIATGMTALARIDSQDFINELKLKCSHSNSSVCEDGDFKIFVHLNVKYFNRSGEFLLYLAESRYATLTNDRVWPMWVAINRRKLGTMKFFDAVVPVWEYMITKW